MSRCSHWVKKDGGDPSGIIGVEAPFTAMMDQLKSGRVDAAGNNSSHSSVRCSPPASSRSLGHPSLAVADPVLFPFWIADADWARANRDVLKEFRTSL